METTRGNYECPECGLADFWPTEIYHHLMNMHDYHHADAHVFAFGTDEQSVSESYDSTGPAYHNHRCTGCGDTWPCENDLCESAETVDDYCDACDDGY